MKGYEMRWYVYIEGKNVNGKFTDKLYCTSRDEARFKANFYRTMCDPALDIVKVVDMGKWTNCV